METYIYVKLTKEWGGFSIGDVVRFGEYKGEDRIREGFGVKVPKQKAVNDPDQKRQVEVAVKPPNPKMEIAEAKPIAKPKTKKGKKWTGK